MTYLELTRLAAKAYGLDVSMLFEDNRGKLCGPLGTSYDPLTDTAQAFELMEKLRMLCMVNMKDKWLCKTNGAWAENTDLKRAIVECAARYQLEKEKQA